MKFTKMQGIGNDYVYVNCFEETVEDPCETAKMVSDRHFGIGSDGLILIKPSDVADCQMDMYNLDGSRGAMCGNGIRCVGKYAYDHGIVDKPEIDVETPSGIKHLSMKVKDGKVELVTVDMGRPVLTSEIGEPITVDGKEYRFTGVSMGNPHAVVFMDGIKDPLRVMRDSRTAPIQNLWRLWTADMSICVSGSAAPERLWHAEQVHVRLWSRAS